MNRYNRFKEPRREHRPPPLSPTSPPQMHSPGDCGVPPMNGDQVMLLQQVQVHQQQVDHLLQQYKVQHFQNQLFNSLHNFYGKISDISNERFYFHSKLKTILPNIPTLSQ